MSRNVLIISVFTLVLLLSCNKSSEEIKQEELLPVDACKETVIPNEVIKLMKSYHQIEEYRNNYLIFNDGDSLIYDDNIQKDFYQLINNPSVKDMFATSYIKGEKYSIEKGQDPGRYRNIEFFRKIYGATKQEVQDSLVKIIWCPKTVNQPIYVTKINGVADKLQKISTILDSKPHLTKYVKKPGGTFNWRNIRNTDRLSMHSFGMTIDINIDFSDYWQWSCKCSDEDANVQYTNRIPIELAKIFEEEGFIWGGKWYHFDTMHFEYRPELLN